MASRLPRLGNETLELPGNSSSQWKDPGSEGRTEDAGGDGARTHLGGPGRGCAHHQHSMPAREAAPRLWCTDPALRNRTVWRFTGDQGPVTTARLGDPTNLRSRFSTPPPDPGLKMEGVLGGHPEAAPSHPLDTAGARGGLEARRPFLAGPHPVSQ